MIDRRGLRPPLLLAAVALALAACSSSPSPSPTSASTPAVTPAPSVAATLSSTPTPVPQPTPVGTSSSVAAPCEPADVKASHGLVEGAAGSRLTSVVIVVAITCSVEAFPAFALRDANGAPVIGGVSGGPGRIDLDPDESYSAEVRVGNWCANPPRFPLALELVANGQPIAVTGSSFPEEDDLPPCNGGSGPILEAEAWVVSP